MNKVRKLFYLLIISLASLSVTAQENHADIGDYTIKVTVDTVSRLLKVNLTMDVSNLTGHKIELIFTHRARIDGIYLNQRHGKKDVSFQAFGVDSVCLTLPDNTNLSDKLTLFFDYSIPFDSVSGSTRCVHTLTRPEKWYPLLYNELSAHRITVSLPMNYSALSSGDMIKNIVNDKQKVMTWYDKNNFTCPLFFFKTDSLQFVQKKSADKNIDFWFYSRDTIIQNGYTKIVCASFRYFYNLFEKDYPYHTYSFIEIPDYPAGSALGSLQIFGTTPLSDFNTYGMLYCLKPAAHEVAHEWWGVGRIHYKDKTNEDGVQFLRESMTEYLTYMFIEQYWGADSLAKCLETANSYYKYYVNDTNEKLLFDIPQQFTTWEEAVVVYYKGPLIIHEIRKQMGDANWQHFINRFYISYRNKYAGYNDFIKTLLVYDQNGAITETLNNYLKTKGFKEIKP
ncbi:MAG: M1 family aminopeptidase [Bacteroidota bacterium]